MRYLIGTKVFIDNVNTKEGWDRGCRGDTTMWYNVRETAAGLFCLMVDDDKSTVKDSNGQSHATITLEPVFKYLSL